MRTPASRTMCPENAAGSAKARPVGVRGTSKHCRVSFFRLQPDISHSLSQELNSAVSNGLWKTKRPVHRASRPPACSRRARKMGCKRGRRSREDDGAEARRHPPLAMRNPLRIRPGATRKILPRLRPPVSAEMAPGYRSVCRLAIRNPLRIGPSGDMRDRRSATGCPKAVFLLLACCTQEDAKPRKGGRQGSGPGRQPRLLRHDLGRHFPA